MAIIAVCRREKQIRSGGMHQLAIYCPVNFPYGKLVVINYELEALGMDSYHEMIYTILKVLGAKSLNLEPPRK